MALHDVTKQRALETKKNRTLLNSQEHLRMAAEAALIGTWEADPQTGVRHWSSQFRAILGVSEDIQPSVGLFSS